MIELSIQSQAIPRTKVDSLSIGPSRTNLSDITIDIFPSRKKCLLICYVPCMIIVGLIRGYKFKSITNSTKTWCRGHYIELHLRLASKLLELHFFFQQNCLNRPRLHDDMRESSTITAHSIVKCKYQFTSQIISFVKICENCARSRPV